MTNISKDATTIGIIWASIQEVMHVQSLAVLGFTPISLFHHGVFAGQHPIQIAIYPSSQLQLRCL